MPLPDATPTSPPAVADHDRFRLAAQLLAAIRDEWAQQLMPLLPPAAMERAEYARLMLDRLATDLDGQSLSPALRSEAEALFAAIGAALGTDGGRIAADAQAADVQQQLVEQLRRLEAQDLEPLAELWQRAATLGAALRARIEAQRRAPASAATSAAATLTTATLETYLCTQWPASADLRVSALQVLPGGRSKTTVFVGVDGGPHGDALVLRQDLPNGMIEIASGTTRVADEYPLIVAAHRAGLPVAEPVWLEPAPTALGAPFMLTRRCDGQSPGTWRGFDAPDHAATRSAVGHLAEVLAQLHQLPLAACGFPDAHTTSTETRMQRELDYRWHKWQHDSLAPFPVIECAFARLRRECRHGLGAPVLVHGDVLPHNLLVDAGRITALLDWEFAHPGDPAEDLAYCRAAVEAVMPWPQFMQRYRDAGGPALSARRLAIYGLFGLVRNSALLASAAQLHAQGVIDDFTTAAIGHLSLPMMETLIGAQLHALDTLREDEA